MCAPILLFVYKRLWHTQQTIQALIKNDLAARSKLIIFSDGPKRESDITHVEQVRNYIKTIAGFESIEIIESPSNKGLANSIIDGVTQSLMKYDSVIVIEDDLVTSPYFLSYMNQGLALYENDEAVISIHGYSYPVSGRLPQSFFIRGADCWGWATWRRAWSLFEKDGKTLLHQLQEGKLAYEFDYGNTYPFLQMLKDQIQRKNDSWAIRWNASAFLKNKLTLYPGVSFVQNIGFDSSGTHSNIADKVYESQLQSSSPELKRIVPEENKEARQMIAEFFRKSRRNILQRIVDKGIRLLK